jgi:hypothetical protein
MFARIMGLSTVLLVGAGVWAGFAAAGSPQHARELALDAQRQSDLWAISDELTFTNSPDALAPAGLPARIVATRRLDGSSTATDPVTHKPYEYDRIGVTQYRLCATFALASDPLEGTQAHLRHRAGRSCYRFDVRSSSTSAE